MQLITHFVLERLDVVLNLCQYTTLFQVCIFHLTILFSNYFLRANVYIIVYLKKHVTSILCLN